MKENKLKQITDILFLDEESRIIYDKKGRLVAKIKNSQVSVAKGTPYITEINLRNWLKGL